MPRRPVFHIRVEEEQLIGTRGEAAWDGDEQREQPPLGVKLTGYRLLIVGVILVCGVTKMALACCGQSSALTTLDWVAGVSSAFILYWVGQFETRSVRQPRWPLFFDVDWAPEILEAMKSVEIPFVQGPLPTILLAPSEYVRYSNKINGLNYYAQDSRPAGLRPRTFLQNYMSPLTMAFLFITLPFLESSFLFLVP